MSGWFQTLPIHRKLVLTSIAKTTVVLFAAMVALLALDAFRFQGLARQDTTSLAQLIAENIRASLAFEDQSGLDATIYTLRLRPQVQRGCVFDRTGALVAGHTRPGFVCPASYADAVDTSRLATTAPVWHEGEVIGHVYVARDWAILRDRLVAAALASLIVLILASLVMLLVSHRLHRNISEPIRQLAHAASLMGQSDQFQMPAITAPPDEVGQLVAAFGAMAGRVRGVNLDLSLTNDALRREIIERQRIQAEREVVLQREREANRVKDEFLATVSHELRTPLNAIVGWSHILVTTTPDQATVAKAAASLYRNAQAQARVIDDLIDISRIVTGKLRVHAEPVDLRSVVDSAVESIRPEADRAGVSLTVVLPHTNCVISGDRDRLRQIVWNLLSNAVKFAPEGTVRVSIVQEEGQLRFEVADSGVGISTAFLPKVFDRFRQADSSITREHGGLGIGLAVVKELVELHQGKIRVESPGPGTGTTFTVMFPCVESGLPEEIPEERVPSLSGVSVLAVDDNQDSLEVLKAVLEASGAETRLAPSGDEALAQWHREPADVLLCDLAMPGMSGYQLLGHIRELDRQAGRVTPAIAVTAHASEEQVARSAQAGFQNHISKPINSGQLVRAIHAARTRV